jgi:hypothetical protein
MKADLFAIPEGVAGLNNDELTVWNAFQRFLQSIPLASEGPLSHDAVAITAALLVLATATAFPAKPI